MAWELGQREGEAPAEPYLSRKSRLGGSAARLARPKNAPLA